MKPYEIGEEVYYIYFNNCNIPVEIRKSKITDIINKIWYKFENNNGKDVHINYVFRNYEEITKLYDYIESS